MTELEEMRIKEWEEMMKEYEERKKEYARIARIKEKEYLETSELSTLTEISPESSVPGAARPA
ncbi:hypothetical protein FACS189498_0330 [Spirochaetia bacterium]|nr:hypothetical protein FACS189498_0330 [Spirochaetia bacterium]